MEEQKKLIRQGIIYKRQINNNENYNTLVILNENAKNRTMNFAKICANEEIKAKNIDITKIEDFDKQYKEFVNFIFSISEYAFDIKQELTKDYDYKTEYSGGNSIGSIGRPTLFIIYNNDKKISEEIVIYDKSLDKINLEFKITNSDISITGGSTSWYTKHMPNKIEIRNFKNMLREIKILAKTYNTKLKNAIFLNKAIQDFENTNTYLHDYNQAYENFNKQKELLQPLKEVGYIKEAQELSVFLDSLPKINITYSMKLAYNINKCLTTAIEDLEGQSKNSNYIKYNLDIDL